ncbi:MAG: hypothetical protein ACYTBZ_25495, partial [Planctomycetota bacterium]
STQPADSFTLDLAACFELTPDVALEHVRHLESFEELFNRAKTEEQQATIHVATANWILAVPSTGACTAWLLGLETPADRLSIRENTTSALEYLSEARSILEEDTNLPDKERNRLTDALEALEAFAELFLTVSSPGQADDYGSACARAALKLSVVREADDKSLAACARLWQSFAWELAERRRRALVSLPEALAKPQQWPYDFMCRLLRCRILADAGKYTAATTAAIRMRALCGKWLEGEGKIEDTAACRRLVALLQCRVGRLWMQHLNSSDAARLEGMLIGIQKDLFESPQPINVYGLDYAVPIIVQPPVIASPATSSGPATQSAPATEPARVGWVEM